MNLKLICSLILIPLVNSQENTRCPLPSVEPCICTHDPFAFLTCDDIESSTILSTVFRRSKSTYFHVVTIRDSVMEYLPDDLFVHIKLSALHLENVRLHQLFEHVPEHIDTLKTLFLERVFTFRELFWEQFKEMSSLEKLNIYHNDIEELGDDFALHVPDSLEQISFFNTRTATIKPGVFQKFKLLNKIAIDKNELTELTRDMLPKPFNGRFLHFNDNHIKWIPTDLITDMPNLLTFSLRGNKIKNFPELIYEGDSRNIMYFILENNPIHCDCKLKWLKLFTPQVLKGACYSPPGIQGKNLNEIVFKDLICPT